MEKVLTSGQFILGTQVTALESEFADFCGTKYAVGVASGTDALSLSLLASGLQRGDEVITVSFTAFATVAAIVAAGGQPVFVDVDPETYTMDVSRVEDKITGRTRAIIPVHLYGHPTDMSPLVELGQRYNLTIIEDACQAHGSRYSGRRVGSLGHIGCFSFYPTKNLGAYGDGGMVVTNDEWVAARVRLLRNQGQGKRFHHMIHAVHSRLDELQAAILRVKLAKLEGWNARRRQIAELYRQELGGAELILPIERPWALHNYHLYVVQVDNREDVSQRLAALGVASDVHYPLPVHLQPAYASFGCREGDLPVTERLAQRVMTLPMYPELEDAEVRRVAAGVKSALEQSQLR